MVDLSSLDTSWHGGTVSTTSDLDVEGLRPELPIGDSAIVMDRSDLSTEDIVAAGDTLGDGNGLLVAAIVEDGVSAPVSGLLCGVASRVAAGAVVDESALVDLEELERGLIDVLAVAGARGKVGHCPAVMAAVPANFVTAAAALMGPSESNGLAGRSFNSVRGWRSVNVSDHIGVAQLVSKDGLVAIALVGPPSGRVVPWVPLAVLIVSSIGLTASVKLHDTGVGGHGGDERRQKGAGLNKLRHRHGELR